MISTIKNNIKKDLNPKIEILNRFSSVVNKKIEENVDSKKTKVFYDNAFFVVAYVVSIFIISSLLSISFSLFSMAFIFSMFPIGSYEVFKGLVTFSYLIFSFYFLFISCCYSHSLVVGVVKRIPFLKNITNYFAEKNEIRDNSIDSFLKEGVVEISQHQINFMNTVVDKIDKKNIEKILSGLEKESPSFISKLNNIFNKIEKKEELEINEKIFLMAKLSDVETSKYNVVFELLKE